MVVLRKSTKDTRTEAMALSSLIKSTTNTKKET
jgi:hypothetical protein